MLFSDLTDIGSRLTGECGAVWGILVGEPLWACLPPEARPLWRSAVVAAFPYYSGGEPGKVALFARNADYHPVVRRLLTQSLGDMAEDTGARAFADVSPLREVQAAVAAGVGVLGKNGLLITEPYGSFTVLGALLFPTAPEDVSVWPGAPYSGVCMQCNACVSACPTGALRGVGTCLSALTQKKHLAPEEEDVVKRLGSEWGCDVCQLVCPMNQKAVPTQIPEFTDGPQTVWSLQAEALSNRELKERYGDRSFFWRGPAVLRRNSRLVSGVEPEEPG